MFFSFEGIRNATSPALYDSVRQRWWTYEELATGVAASASVLAADRKLLAFCFCRNNAGAVFGYLSAIEAGHAVALLDDGMAAEFKTRLIELYKPDYILASDSADYGGCYTETNSGSDLFRVWRRPDQQPSNLHPSLAVLLSTSGTTGSPKFVRLSHENVRSNADSIRQALEIQPDHRPITSLPFHYSYGLSVLNSHLLAGAALVLTNDALMAAGFWSLFRNLECTSFAGVPYAYQVLHRLGLDRLNVPSLRYMTQAGGKLNNELIAVFHELMARRGGRFYVMYGQTEATARMTILPWDKLPEKLGSVGLPIPGGRITINGAGPAGEVVYCGPNVMMGYANERADLALGDVLGGQLRTGDNGYLDQDGFLFIAGRAKRDAKVFGLRINLDEVEAILRARGPTAVIGGPDCLLVFCEYGNEEVFGAIRKDLAATLKVNHQALQFFRVDQLPITSNGKIDYAQLQIEAGQRTTHKDKP